MTTFARLFLFVLTISLSACCSKNSDGSQTCLLQTCSDDVSGYVVFGNGLNPTTDADIVLEWSTDSFASDVHTGVTVRNSQGFVVAPFEFSASHSCGSIPTIELRAFESPNHSGIWVSGNTVGRHDGTSTGNGPLTPVSASSATNITFFLDGTGAQ